jgi:hypothetical protein
VLKQFERLGYCETKSHVKVRAIKHTVKQTNMSTAPRKPMRLSAITSKTPQIISSVLMF